MKFEGTKDYIATEDLRIAVNAAVTLERPLLIKGEPGTGKTVLAEEVSKALKMPLITWHIKSTTKAQQGLYEYDAITRLRDSQLGDEKVKDIKNYIKQGKLWEAFESNERPILLIDEIDKADIEFPNDLLQELDRMEFFVYETNETIKAAKRAGANCIKLQTYTQDTLTINSKKDDFMINGGTIWDGTNYYSLYKKAHTPWQWHKKLFDVANEEGLVCFSSPFDFTAVDFLEKLNCPAYKIVSFVHFTF